MKRGDFLGLEDLSAEQLQRLLGSARTLKAQRTASSELLGQSIALLFEKPSLRTRTSFAVGIYELGGQPVYLGPDEVGLGRRESAPDVARVLSQYVHGIVARTFHHDDLRTLAATATVPVINALSDFSHPCQGLADLLTLWEHFDCLEGVRLAYVGDGNNIARTLVYAAAKTGLDLRIASPPGYQCDESTIVPARAEAREHGGDITLLTDPREAVADADAVYTDVWTSMGQEAESEQRRRDFVDYQLDLALLKLAKPEALAMHDLPAHRGEEITDEVLDGPQSVVVEQATNRLPAQKAILVWLLGKEQLYGF